jgi:hypothetical protein
MAIWAILLTRADRRAEAMERADEACRMSFWLVERYEKRHASLHAATRLAQARADGSPSFVDGAERFYRATRAEHGTTAETELITDLLRDEPAN